MTTQSSYKTAENFLVEKVHEKIPRCQAVRRVQERVACDRDDNPEVIRGRIRSWESRAHRERLMILVNGNHDPNTPSDSRFISQVGRNAR